MKKCLTNFIIFAYILALVLLSFLEIASSSCIYFYLAFECSFSLSSSVLVLPLDVNAPRISTPGISELTPLHTLSDSLVMTATLTIKLSLHSSRQLRHLEHTQLIKKARGSLLKIRVVYLVHHLFLHCQLKRTNIHNHHFIPRCDV